MDWMVGVMDVVVVLKNGGVVQVDEEVPWFNDGRERGDFRAALTPKVVKRACPHGRSDGPRLSMTKCLTVNYTQPNPRIESSIDLISIAKVL
jgi:hypothetical protein